MMQPAHSLWASTLHPGGDARGLCGQSASAQPEQKSSQQAAHVPSAASVLRSAVVISATTTPAVLRETGSCSPADEIRSQLACDVLPSPPKCGAAAQDAKQASQNCVPLRHNRPESVEKQSKSVEHQQEISATPVLLLIVRIDRTVQAYEARHRFHSIHGDGSGTVRSYNRVAAAIAADVGARAVQEVGVAAQAIAWAGWPPFHNDGSVIYLA